MRAKLLSLGLATLCVNLARADYNPVPLTPGSFTQDIVIEKTAPPPLQNFANVTLDNGTNDTGNTFFEAGFATNLPWMGLPPHGATFISHNDANHVWQMPPSYVTNNVAYVGSGNIPGSSPGILQTQVLSATLTFKTPAPYTAVSILWAAAVSPGDGVVDYSVNFNGGSPQPGTLNIIDWFNGSANYEYIASGRVSLDAGATPVNQVASTTTTKLFRTDIYLGDTTDPVTSISFNYNGTGVNTNYRFMVFSVSASTDNVQFNPVPVSGYNYDAVVESNAWYKCAYLRGFNVTMDGGVSGTGNTFYEQGFCYLPPSNNPLTRANLTSTTNGVTAVTSGAPFSGLPHPGTTIAGTTDANHVFQMPPTYATNHCVFFGNYSPANVNNLGLYSSPTYQIRDYNYGSLNIVNPVAGYNKLSLLGSAGNGPLTIAYTNYYNNGSSDTGTFLIYDWFGGPSTNIVWNAAGRVDPAGGSPAFNNLNGSPAGALRYYDIPANPAAAVTNISFAFISGGRGGLFALSASTDGTHFTPLAVSGYDASLIVPKEQPAWPAALFTYTTATMDNGMNNYANTWSERGWVTNGVGAGGGLPPAGSTINSVSDATHHYQMPASYSANNAVLLDINHGAANITPQTPATYSAVSLLTAGASIGGGTMTNICVLQHADGVNETNLFLAFDWFNANTSLPGGGQLAFISNGRSDNRGGTQQNTAGGTNGVGGVSKFPRIFESFFLVNDTASAVTNILLFTNTLGGANWTTYVLAVSAGAGQVSPILGPAVANTPTINVAGEYTRYEGGGVTLSLASYAGGSAAPTSFQWQYSPDFGTTWVDVNNGGGFSGATTTNLVIASLGWTNSGAYRINACNAAGCASSTFASLRVFSTVTDVTAVSDAVVPFQPNGGNSPNTEQVQQAIENLVGVDNGGTPKYLNFGGNNGAPFLGPVGLVVSPQVGKTTLSALRIYTANDAPERDPIDFGLEGSNDGGNTWIYLAGGALRPPAARNTNNPSVAPDPLRQAVQEVHFSLPPMDGYLTYRLSFTNVNNNTTANSMQISEIELLGVLTPSCPIITQDVAPDVRVYAGGSATFAVKATGSPAPTYQWYRSNDGGANYNPIGGATASSYTLANVQNADNGAKFECVVANNCGTPTTSGAATLTVLTAPTAPYASRVLQDGPVAWLRLNEGPDDGGGGNNNGTTAYDYAGGGHNGYYTNAIIAMAGYNPAQDTDTAAYFGQSSYAYIPTSGTPDSAVEGINGIDFSKAAGQNGAFSVEAWVMGDPNLVAGGPIAAAGIISKGYGSGGEQFALDCGGPANGNFAHTFRFFVRDGGSETPAINATGVIGPDPGVWHHLVGVCDEANGQVQLYIDGVPQTPGTITPGAGIHTTAQPVTVGARSSTSTTNNNLTFYGTIDEAAIYPYALSLAQVQNHYYATTNLPPTLQAGSDLPTNSVVYAGRTLTLTGKFLGTPPLSYQWFRNGNAIGGATTSTYTIPNAGTNDAGTYYVQACNNYNGGTCATSGSDVVTVETVVDFNAAGAGWQFQVNDASGTATRGFDGTLPDAVLTLTDSQNSEAAASFYQNAVYIGAFQAFFTYQKSAPVGDGGADGATFCIQNDPRGAAAVGGGGGSLGVSGITPSVELEFNVYPNNTPGYALSFNGGNGNGAYTPMGSVDPSSSDPIDVSLLYNGTTLSMSFTDTVTHATFQVSTNLNIPALVGNKATAFVGFTAATGGANATQKFSNFSFVPVPRLTSLRNGDGSLTLSWPATIGGFTLLEATSLQPANWVVSSAAVSVVSGNYTATVAPASAAKFYRLGLNTQSPQ